jgi:cysteinyl-tRNA synthetase
MFMNITDVGHLVADEDESVLSEDKFEKGARREGKSVWDVAAHYADAFKTRLWPRLLFCRLASTPSAPKTVRR